MRERSHTNINFFLCRGQFQLVYFGFTFCPDICPVELKKICDVVDQIGASRLQSQMLMVPRTDAKGLGKYLQPLFITVDPQRDSVHQIREYLKGTTIFLEIAS